jgi:hypothetical protein
MQSQEEREGMNRDDIIRIAKAVGLGEVDEDGDIWCSDGFYTEEIDSFAQFAYDAGRKAERKKMELDGIHTCHNNCQRPICVAVREAVAAEREACAKVCDVLADKHTFEGGYANECAIAIRERGAP